jgi:transcriptional regulator with XRE-family HTH domain
MKKITPEHISRATGKQLSRLFGVSENTITAWTLGQQEASGRHLSRAAETGIPKDVLLLGLDLRRKRAEEAQRLRLELESCIPIASIAAVLCPA